MALRNLVARMRTPAAAALRLPPPPPPPGPAPRVSPPRPRFYGSAQNGKHIKGIDLESASIEEIRRQADLVGKEIDEALERTKEEVPVIWKDIWGTMRLWLVAGAGIELLLFADSRLRPLPEVEAET